MGWSEFEMNPKNAKLNNAKLKTLPLGKSVCDGNNLYFTRTGDGKGKFTYRYQRLGRKHEMGLGPWPPISLAEARQKARDAHTAIHNGLDPLAERRKAEAHRKKHEGIRFSDVAKRYIDTHQDSWTNAKHAHDWASTLERYAYPILDQKPLSELGTEDVLEVLEPIWRDKHETAKKIQGRIKLVFGYARTGQLYFGENPAIWQDHLSHYFAGRSHRKPIKHHRALTYKQMPEFYAKLAQVETMASYALQFTILTALRTSEVLRASSDQIDLNKLIWNVPAPQMKTKKPHQVPLSDTAAELVESVMRSHNAPFIFHGRDPEKSLSNMAMLTLVNRELKEFDTTVHGLRSTFRVWGGEQTSHDFGAMEFALAHQQDKVSAAYNRTTLLELRRPLMQDWACYVTGRDQLGQLAPNRLN